MSSEIMTSSEDKIIIQADSLGKCYKIYDDPKSRLKQALLRGRKKYYREFWALRNVSFEVKRGESLGIIGGNGSGKSTLLQMICGTLMPSEGSIRTSGSIAALLELGSGFNPDFTGIENVYLNASLLGLSYQATESRLDDIKAFADIGDFINQPVKTYSSGMLVRLAFAVIAHVDPSILVVDEALSVGDAIFGQRCMRFIRRFAEQGTLLFVSHDLNSVSSICQRALWIDSGHLRMASKNTTVITAYTKYCHESSGQESSTRFASHKSAQHHIQRTSSPSKQEEATSHHSLRITHALPASNAAATKTLAAEVADWNEGQDYGNKNSLIIMAALINSLGESTSAPHCGDMVYVSISAQCTKPIHNFMAGFIVRDRTGMIIWGENNIQHGPLETNAGDRVTIDFGFPMPFLRPGSYGVSVAISENDIDIPTVMHYKPDAFIIEPISGSQSIHGIFAIPNMTILSEITP